MVERYKIAAYTRISVDVEKDTDNTSIENQKAIIAEYCKTHFPTSTVDYYEDRDKSGYTFNQRPCYYYELRPKLMSGEYDILIIKDLSRFSRRTGKGLAEFEDLVENNLRIISIGESIAYEVMANWGANHGAISYGHIGADLITLCSMLRIPVCMHNVPEEKIFRPAAWNAFGMDKESADYRACATYGPMYK